MNIDKFYVDGFISSSIIHFSHFLELSRGI